MSREGASWPWSTCPSQTFLVDPQCLRGSQDFVSREGLLGREGLSLCKAQQAGGRGPSEAFTLKKKAQVLSTAASLAVINGV